MVACRPAFVIRANTESILRSARDQDGFRMTAPSAVVKHLAGPIPHAHKKSRMSGLFCRHVRDYSALASLETGVALADHEHLAATTHDLAIAVPRLGGLQRIKHLHGRLLTPNEKLKLASITRLAAAHKPGATATSVTVARNCCSAGEGSLVRQATASSRKAFGSSSGT